MLAQYSPHALIPGEQFGIGGGGSAMGGFISVRGYREREIVGDYGASFNIEALGPDFARLVNSESLSLRPLGFLISVGQEIIITHLAMLKIHPVKLLGLAEAFVLLLARSFLAAWILGMR